MNENIIEILRSAEYGPDYVKFVSELDRNDYEEVNKILTRLQGKWNKKRKAHLFAFKPKPLVMAVIKSGKLPEKNPTAFFPTPAAAGMEVMRMADLVFNGELITFPENRCNVLEPSAGHGALAKLARQALPNATIDTVEFLEINQQVLRDEGFDPFCGDFMEFNTDYKKKYRYIFMNPPFSLKGDTTAYITHILHAHKMLDDYGQLVAIVPPGFMKNKTKKEMDFYNMVLELGTLVDLPAESFKESGTTIDTVIVEMGKSSWKAKPRDGYTSHFAYELRLVIDSEYELHMESERLLSKMLNANTFDREAATVFCEKAVEQINNDWHTFPPSRIDEYVDMLEWMFELDYKEEIQRHPERMEPQPLPEYDVQQEQQVIVEKPKVNVKEAKAVTPTLFEFAA